MAKYVTHTDPPLTLEWTDLKVTLTGAVTKVLYEGEDKVEAKAVYDYAREHYEQRRIALETEGVEAEGKVEFYRTPA